MKLEKKNVLFVLFGLAVAIILVSVGSARPWEKLKPDPPVPILVEVDGVTYYMGSQQKDVLSQEEQVNIALNLIALILTHAEDEGMVRAREQVGFTGPMVVTPEMLGNPQER